MHDRSEGHNLILFLRPQAGFCVEAEAHGADVALVFEVSLSTQLSLDLVLDCD